MDIFLTLVAFFFPPVPVLLKRGCNLDLLLNVLLCFVGFWIGGNFPPPTPRLPLHFRLITLCLLVGVIHAWYIIHTTPGVIYK